MPSSAIKALTAVHKQYISSTHLPPVPAVASAAAVLRVVVAITTCLTTSGSSHLPVLHAAEQVRKIIAKRLLESKLTAPSLYLTADVALDAVSKLRKTLAEQGSKVSLNDFVMRAAALALRDVPTANAFWDEARGAAVQQPSVDVCVAVATDGGLITPIVKAADTKSLLQISQEVKDLAARARANKLKPEEFMGGTFSISNLGMYGLSNFSAIINPPQAAILAVGGAQKRVSLSSVDRALSSSSFMTVTLSADHRLFDGGLATQLLDAFTHYMESPLKMVL
jgi:pyruvate dehydrogenase E2 component (dihydrolipoamide acetyltransferase)